MQDFLGSELVLSSLLCSSTPEAGEAFSTSSCFLCKKKNASGVRKHSNQTEKVHSANAEVLATPPCEHLHAPQLVWRLQSLGAGNTEVSLGSQANPNPRRKLTTRGDGLSQALGWLYRVERCLPYWQRSVLLFLRDCLSLLKS